MAKGGKGRKGGGGGGGKTRKYSRDNNGRFASTGTGATARGGRLLTAKGNKRKTQTITAAGKKGVLAKPKGLKQQSPATYGIAKTKTAKKEVNDRLTKKYSTLPDQATVNIPGRFSGQAGKRFNASIDRAVATVAADKKAQFKTSSEVKATTAANKAAAKPKRVRSAESLRVSRAKQVEKRRSITTNPAGVRASAAAKMAANATRTQERAAAFYKARGKPATAAKPSAAAKPAKAKTVAAVKSVKATEKQRNIREFMDQKGGSVARDYKRDAQAFRQPLAKKDQTAGGPKTVGGALESLASKSYGRAVSKTALTQSESTRAQKLISDNNIKGYKIVRGERGDLLQRVSGVSGKSASLGEAAATRKVSRKPATAAKPAAKRKSVGSISEAKAGRIISRIDANRPGLKPARAARKNANAIKTQQRATDFALAAGARARKRGKALTTNQSLQRGVKNAASKPSRTMR